MKLFWVSFGFVAFLNPLVNAVEFKPVGVASLRINQDGETITFERCRGEACIGLGKQDGTFKRQELKLFIERAAGNDPMVGPVWRFIDRWLFRLAVPCGGLLTVSTLAHSIGHPIPYWTSQVTWLLAAPIAGAVVFKPLMDGEIKTAKDQAAVLEIALGQQLEMDAPTLETYISNLDVVLRRIARQSARKSAPARTSKTN